MDMNGINSSDKKLEFGIKTHNFTNPLLVQHTSHHLHTSTNKSTLKHSDNTHKRK